MENNILLHGCEQIIDNTGKTTDKPVDCINKNKIYNTSGRDMAVKIGIVIMLLLFFISSALLYFVTLEQWKVAEGTSIFIGDKLNESIGNLNYHEAVDKSNKIIEDYLNNNINLRDPDRTVTVKLKDIGVSINIGSAIEDIKDSLYTPYIIDSINRHRNYSRKISLVTDVKIDTERFESFINNSLKHIEKNPEEAHLFINDSGEVQIKPDVLGYTLDKQKLLDTIISSVKEYNLDIKIPIKEITAHINRETIKELMPTKVISSFSTYYEGSDSGRKTNVELGAKLINNVLLKPGEEFEFWKYVGETTFERGFKLAGIFKNGKPATGIGGGLCQVSTTLYNAALLADLEITERSPHGLPVYYVPLGLDATVATGYFTLRFVNNTKGYILIKSSTSKGIINFSIYGDMPEGKTVKTYARRVGPKAADSYRDVYLNGQLVRHEYLGRDYYK